MPFYTCCWRLSNWVLLMLGQSFYVPDGTLIVGGDVREVRIRQVAWFDAGAG